MGQGEFGLQRLFIFTGKKKIRIIIKIINVGMMVSFFIRTFLCINSLGEKYL